jgi:hypothetical protein
MKNLEKLHSEVGALCVKKATAHLTKTSVVELERLAANVLATAALVYQETQKARRSDENRIWRRI